MAHMSINSKEKILFADGGQVPQAAVVKYLGVKIEATGGSSEEVANRLAAASASYAMLRPLWRSSRIPIVQKIRIYQACVLSRMLCCTGVLNITPTQ
eukprot:3583815-Alexandrium_andersonii.AAC.1